MKIPTANFNIYSAFAVLCVSLSIIQSGCKPKHKEVTVKEPTPPPIEAWYASSNGLVTRMVVYKSEMWKSDLMYTVNDGQDDRRYCLPLKKSIDEFSVESLQDSFNHHALFDNAVAANRYAVMVTQVRINRLETLIGRFALEQKEWGVRQESARMMISLHQEKTPDTP